ncbi:MAG: ABC transporter ATP-binding protein [Dehalococcoidia bacterium]|nr:ABC transporter ATP-binding protein [Dehalococcoidia bacterium]
MNDKDVILSVRNLQTHLRTRRGVVKAVDGVSFDVRRGETLGIVGESGSGKSMTAFSIVQLLPRVGRVVGGEVIFNGEDLLKKSPREMEKVRGKHVSMVLQDPLTSLNPVFRTGDQIAETIRHHLKDAPDPKGKAVELMRQVRIPAPATAYRYYPHQMSGGMRQRVLGAIGVSCEPEFLIADEPTSALDPTIQAQYLDLLKDLQKQYNLTIIFITHDFGIVATICDTVAVMYAGKIVETGPVRDVFQRPSHPYTEALLKSLPSLEEKPKRLPSISGQPPMPHEMPTGCRFAPRCPYKFDKCEEYPPDTHVSPTHISACWRSVK